tara:strand:- start:426 stop:794 length:369 start_codon:yes stop_codon:yes gene_type:complete
MSEAKYTHPLRVKKVRHSAMLDTMALSLEILDGPFSTRELIALWLDDWEERWHEKQKQGKAMRRVPRYQPTTVTVGLLLRNDPRFFNINASYTTADGTRTKPSGGSQWVLKSNHLSVTLVVE